VEDVVGDVMEEGIGRAIPLRRTRGNGRAVVVPPTSWSERLGAGARRVAASPRQLWLAGLGSLGLLARGARTAWVHAVSEGATVEGWLRSLAGSDSAGTPTG
jgi:hypothetical protein